MAVPTVRCSPDRKGPDANVRGAAAGLVGVVLDADGAFTGDDGIEVRIGSGKASSILEWVHNFHGLKQRATDRGDA